MTPYDFLASLWRTAVPYVVAFLGVQAARLGIDLDDATITTTLTGLFGTGYYAAFRYAEQRFSPGWGWALGLARPPVYPKN
ncbi:hypothetical protein [Streptomyces ginkgonis]|uniref:hypothetical protein n=1 Tax=Streptomyces ginkgonis TaxID=1812259 RepID=UPI002176ECD3|nr:hypothetical protein [Streptomyces ginkgonis]